MSGVGAIDLTLSLSDSDDDDVPIFLSSSRYTPLRSVSAEFEVIGEITPAGNQSASETQRSRNRSPVTPSKGKALKTVAASSSASSERPIEHIYEELNIGETSPVRPRPRRRKRPVVEDEPVARSTTPDSLPPEPSPLALPEPDLLQQVKVAAEEVDILEQVQSRVQMECVEEISAHKSSSQEPTEGRSLCDASAELDGLNDEASIYLPSREPTPAMQVDSEDLLADASTQLVSQIEQQSKGVVEWQVLEELLLDTSGLSISLPSEDEASQLDLIPEESVIGEASGSRSASMAQEVDSRSVQATVAAALMDIHCPLKSPPTSRTDACVPPLTSGESVSPIASRIGLRNRKKSVEMEMVGQRGLNTRTASPVSPALIPNEASTPRTSLLSATSSHFSNISSASSQTFERGSVRRRGGVSARVRASLFEAEQNDLTSTRPESRSEQSVSSGDKQHNADRHTPTLEGEHSFVREAQRTIAIEDDWSILPAYKTPKTTTPSRRSQNYAVKSLETTPQSKKWGSTDAVDVESSNTTSTTRRGTRVRKATQKLGDFVPLGEILRKSPRSSQIESGNTLARQSTLVAENGHSAATLLMQVITPSTDASFNLSRVSPPAHAQETLPASPSESKRSDSGRWRRSERDVSIASTPTSAVSIVKKPRLRLKLISTPKQNQVVPFPPAGLPAESNEYLSTQDLEDMTLMAIFAVLNEAGNKAMGATEIAETYATHDWMQKKSPMTPLDVYTTLRNYLKRTAFAQRKSLIAKQTLQGTSAEAYLKPGLHPDVAARANRNGYTRGCVWYLEGKYGSSHWESPFASLRPEKEKIHLRAPQSKTQSRRASKAKLVQPPPLQSAPKRSEVISRPGQQSKPDQRPNQLRRWASSYRYTSSASSRKSVTSSESEEEEGEDLEICKLDDDEEHLIPDANEYSAGSDMNQSVSALDIDIDSVSHSDSASHTESDTQFEAVRQLCKMSLKQSPVPARTTAIPIAESAVRDDEGRAVIQVITSAGSDTAVFPDNPLKPFRWEHGPIASSGSFSFNDSPPEDILHLSNDSDVVMKDVENERAVSYPSKMPFSFERNIDQMSLWNEERALFSEPPDLIDEDFEAISTTPTSSKDSDILADIPYLRDVTLSGDREDWTEHLLDMEETSDGSLIKVARVLGRLLPSGHNMLDAIIHDPNSPTTNYTARRRSGHGRSSFFSHRKPSTVPLGLPTCCEASPLSSPRAKKAAQNESRANSPSLEQPLDSRSTEIYPAFREIDGFDLLSNLQKQMAEIDIDSEKVCIVTVDGVKESHSPCRWSIEKTQEMPEDPELGPESVGMAELDNLLGVSAGIASSVNVPSPTTFMLCGYEKSISTVKTSHRLRSAANAVQQDGTQHFGHVKQQFDIALPQNLNCITSQRHGHTTDICMAVDESDRIGIKEVDDAILYAWSEGGCLVYPEDAEDSSAQTNSFSGSATMTRDSSMETELDSISMSSNDVQDSAPISVDPSVLSITRPLCLSLPSKLPSVPLLGRSSTSKGRSTTWNDNPKLPQGSKAVPPFAIRPRAMMKCVPLRTGGATSAAAAAAAVPPMNKDHVKSPGPRSRDATAPSLDSRNSASIATQSSNIGTPSNHIPAVPSDKNVSAPAKIAAAHPEVKPSLASLTSSPLDVGPNAPRTTSTVPQSRISTPTVTGKMVGNVPLFVILWKGFSLFRRIDTNYINVSSLCQSLNLEDKTSEFRKLPAAELVTDDFYPEANGLWLHLSLLAGKAETLGIPHDLACVLLNPNLVDMFPKYAQTYAKLSRAGPGAGPVPRFGPSFGWSFEKLAALQEARRNQQKAGAARVRAALQSGIHASPSSAHFQLPAVHDKTDESQPSNTTPVKRPVSTVASSQARREEPPTKRQRPAGSSIAATITPQSNVRPIIPIMTTTTQPVSTI